MYLANDATALAACLRRSDREQDYGGALARMTMPVLLFVGSDDHERIEQARAAADLLPDARLVVLPDVDHIGAITDPGAVVPHVTVFLKASDHEFAGTGGPAGTQRPGTSCP